MLAMARALAESNADGCECGHRRDQHQTGGGPATGWCFAIRPEDSEQCECEAFTAEAEA